MLLFTRTSFQQQFAGSFEVLLRKRSLLTPESCSYAAWQQVSGCFMNSNKPPKKIINFFKNMLKSTKYSVILNLQIRLSIWQNCLNRNLKFIKEHFVTIFKLGNYSKIKAAFLESMLISKTILRIGRRF